MPSLARVLVLTAPLLIAAASAVAAPAAPASRPADRPIDLAAATVVAPADLTGPERKAIDMLVGEVERRTGLRLPVTGAWPSDGAGSARPVIAVGPAAKLDAFAGRFAKRLASESPPGGREGFRLRVERDAAGAAVLVVGNDARGVLFGVGRLLRALAWGPRRLTIAPALSVYTAPRLALRGHQLGYRARSTTHDGWTLAMFEQYLRDLVVFGANTVELVSPPAGAERPSPHFPLPPGEMLAGLSRLARDYGLDVWIWSPPAAGALADARAVERALADSGEALAKLARVDALVLPGAEPGLLPPRRYVPMLEKLAARVRRAHPKAEVWLSPQGLSRDETHELVELLAKEPAWVTGVAMGPDMALPPREIRRELPERYPTRLSPDVSHTIAAQYPVPEWDVAYAVTHGRLPISVRPQAMAQIVRNIRRTRGFVTQSEGVGDDVNKVVWAAIGWDDDADLLEILRQYARVFIGPELEDGIAQGLLSLERNWQGPLLANEGVMVTLRQLQALERAGAPAALASWRMQQILYRAYYDAYVRARLLAERALEHEAMDRLEAARRSGAAQAIEQAQAVIDRVLHERPFQAWRSRILELAEALHRGIRLQLSVDKHKAGALAQGATLDTLDVPLSGRLWLARRLAEARKLPSEEERLRALEQIVRWTDPGPGGFYDDLGNPAGAPHLVRPADAEAERFGGDPGTVGFALRTTAPDPPSPRPGEPGFAGLLALPESPRSWWDVAEASEDQPVLLRYSGLDRRGRYRVRVVYAGDRRGPKMRLAADERPVHGPIDVRFRPLEFDLPEEATRDGAVTLAFTQAPGGRGSLRGCQVAEVWLIRK